jgi:predicted TIM-barrel fold metal-dependent hydrolase
LAAGGAWVKLSGWYRLDATLPYAELHGTVGRLADLFGQRMVWGSDWPHTGQPAEPPLPYAATWAPVAAALRPALAARVRSDFPGALYA